MLSAAALIITAPLSVKRFAETRLKSRKQPHSPSLSLSVFVCAAGDGDSKWSVHYTTQKPQQGLRFIPGKRRSGSADDLRGESGTLVFNQLSLQKCEINWICRETHLE